MTKKPDDKKPEPDTKEQVAVYLPGTLFRRLADYVHDKFPGRHNQRNQIIVDAIDEKLEREGY